MADTARERDIDSAVAKLARQVTRTVVANLMRDSGPGEARTVDQLVLQEVEQWSEAIQELLGGRPADEVAELLPSSTHRLATAFRAEILTRTDVAPEDSVSLLRAILELERAAGASDADAAEDLRNWLTTPDAFDLLVEVAHDLRSPLTSIMFLSETLREGHSGDLNAIQRSQLGLIYSAALGLVSVTSDMVDLARGDRGLVQEDDLEPFSGAEVVRGVAEMVRPMAEEKGVELRTVADREGGYGHPIALSRILLNLATNGLKFTDSGHVEIGVTRVSARELKFHVRDTGRGIPEHRLEQLFQPFRRRLRGAGHFFSGSGLGLSISRRLVRAMGSELEVQTSPDWGTRFHFVIDVSKPG